MGSRLDTRTLKDEVASMDRPWLLDLGHPLLSRVADSFIRAAGVGAARAVSREAYFVTVEGLSGGDTAGLDASGPKRSHFSSIRGDDGQKSLDAVVKSAGKEAFQWGLAAGVHSGITYGLREARGCHDWKNSAVAGAIAGVAVALTGDAGGHSDKIVHFAITGAALSSAASLLSGIF
ncbi:outer envelope pore protein 16-2, chloroplastic-like [Phragmites australis]|uniref:outer envelope pore protein 16-2, chloroplastic-like n=1 Tax=Phragmites australis TaxID=29695 RepID=UPI002D7A2EBA|nr:outer envelope pore protein 16-2, chloroplastic-like [Phragmites australis]